jgi:peptidoglycan/LPS O-acetylase OafA/YrhL
MDLVTARPRLPALTSLRFFAALHVVIFHLQALQIVHGPAWYYKLASVGYAGVSFFFVLSGFILVYTYAGRTIRLKEFWRARFARIYPAYAFSLLVTAPGFFYVALYLDSPFWAFAHRHVKLTTAMCLALLQSWVPGAALSWNAVGWSLSVEAFFYALFPFVLLVLLRRSRPQLFLVAVAAFLMTLIISGPYVLLNPDHLTVVNSDVVGAFWLNAVKFHPLARLPEFILGMACGFLFLESRRDSKHALPLVAAGLAAVMIVTYFSWPIPYPILHTALLAPAFAAIVYGFALRPRWGSLLENRVFVLLGDASYSVYLLHVTIMFNFFRKQSGELRYQGFWAVIIYLLLSFTISALVYRFIEEPARQKLNPRRKQQMGQIKVEAPPEPVSA